LDARDLPLPDQSVDAACSDLPFGHLVGSHALNVRLYPALLAEAARVSNQGAPLTLITQEIRLLERALTSTLCWEKELDIDVRVQGLHRRIFLLIRR